MKKLISLLMIAAMILSLAACSGGTEASDSSTSSGTESTASGAESEASEEDPILTGEKPELKVLSMYQAYNYEEQPAWKIDEEITGYKTKWYALPADNADQKLLAGKFPAAQTTTSCSEFPRTSMRSSRSRTR